MNDQPSIRIRGELPHKHLVTLIIIWAFGIFVFDLAIQLGYAGGVPYVVLVLLSIFSPHARFTYLTAAASSLLTLLGYFLSPPGGVLWVVLLNRGLALAVIWITAILVNQYRSADKKSKTAEKGLLESEAKLRTVTETALDAILMVDHETKILYWNGAAERIFGYQASEVMGRSLSSMIIPQVFHETIEVGYTKFKETGTSTSGGTPERTRTGRTIETAARRKDGTEFPIEHAISSTKIGGKCCAVGIIRDITRRKAEVETAFSKLNMEHQRIVQIEKLSAIGLMIGEIAHQINNPLVGVINMTQLALRERDLPENTQEFLEDIQSAGEACRTFLQRMLDFTKIAHFDRKPTDLKELVEETITLCQQSASKSVTITSDFPEHPVRLAVDPILIRHALFNLVTNAMQADENGTIIVRLSPQMRDGGQGAGWSLSVLDQGPGLAKEIIHEVFTPFFTTRRTGTGLGLALVQHVASLHRGEATANNRPGGGAAFTLWLPESHEEVHHA